MIQAAFFLILLTVEKHMTLMAFGAAFTLPVTES